jgi:hypothetical protein
MCCWETKLENLWVIIDLPGTHTATQIALCAVYLPPRLTQSVLEIFIDCNEVIEKTNNGSFGHCFVGDFNLSSINWSLLGNSSGCAESAICQSLINFVLQNNLKQHNNILNSSDRILDLVLSTLETCTVNTSHSALSVIDHLHPPLNIEISITNELKLPYNRDIIKLNFWKADFEVIRKDLLECQWSNLFSGVDNVNDMLQILYDKINTIIKNHVPKIKAKSKHYPSWFSRSLIKTIKEKHKVRRRYKNYKNPRDEIELRLLSARCSRLTTNCYNNYMLRVEADINENPKLFWSYIKTKRGGTSTYPIQMSDGAEFSSDPKKICEYFTAHFASVYTSCGDIEGSQDYYHTANLINLQKHGSHLFIPPFSTELVLKKLKSIDSSKGAGPDGIPPLFIVRCADCLVAPLLTIFNKSVSSGVFPSLWKTAKIMPIFKSGDESLVCNYRPISILCCLAKVLESLICPNIQIHVKQYMTEYQHGFLKSRSTNTNLVDFSESLFEALDSGK